MPNPNNHKSPYSATDIEQYWKGELTPTQMHDMERAALEDPFLAEAMDGYGQIEKDKMNAGADLSILTERLHKRISQNKPAITSLLWWKPAVAALFILFAGSLAWYYLRPESRQDMAGTGQPATPPVLTAPASNDTTSQKDSSVIIPSDVAVLDIEKKKRSAQAIPSIAPITAEKKDMQDSITGIAGKEIEQLAAGSAPAEIAKEQVLYEYQGVVLNEDRQPVPGAIINLKGRVAGVSVMTDTTGRFLVPVSDSVVQLTVNVTGYQSDRYELSAVDSTNNIAINLKPAKAALNEVVVSGYASKKKAADIPERESVKDLSIKVQDAVPVPGWNDYNAYLQQKQLVPDSLISYKGNVVLSFIVAGNGKLSSFIIEQSRHPELDREAIRLVKAGPAWKILKGRKARVIVTVPF